MIEREKLVLIGHPVSHSLSPLMHNAALTAMGSSLRYEAIDVHPDDLATTLAQLARTNCGGNFTSPHKKKAMSLMGECSSLAQRAGAVNTFWSAQPGSLASDNTDVAGFDAMVRNLVGEDPADVRVAVLGAGGAAAAVITAVEWWPGSSVSLHARDLARATAFRMRHSVVMRACSMRDPCLADAQIVVNATPVGQFTDEHPIDLDLLNPTAIVIDLVYSANETSWVRDARARGHTATDGLPMLLYQGKHAFQLWFGVEPNSAVMWNALREATGRT